MYARLSPWIVFCALVGVVPTPAMSPPQVPAVQTANGIQYLNGGMGTEERDAIRCDFPLKLVFATTGGGYLSMVTVRIFDDGGKKVFDIVANNGPWLFVNLSAGRYQVEMDFRGTMQRLPVEIRGPEDRKVFTLKWAVKR